MGTRAAPVVGAGSWPAWIAIVSKRIRWVIELLMVPVGGLGMVRPTIAELQGGCMPKSGPTGDGYVVVVGQWREGQGHAPTPYAVAIRGAGGTPVIFSVFD